MLGYQRVDLGLVFADAGGQVGCVGLGGDRQLSQQGTNGLLLELRLIEQLERPFAGAPTAPQADQR